LISEEHKIGVRQLLSLLNQSQLKLIAILWLTLGASCHSGLFDEGAFPPCMKASEPEIQAMQSLDENVENDQLVLNLLGRTAKFCEAYHARIGYAPSR
tara:strand:- start:1202 stop:1495 length:294 start_codon:yes stop_codon:yes gene_type:complete